MEYSLYCLLVLLTLYTDSPLQGTLGHFGKTLIPLAVLPLYLVMSLVKQFKESDQFVKSLSRLLWWTTAISLFSVFIFALYGMPLVQMGENIILKTFKLILQFFTYCAYMKVLINLTKGMGLEDVLKPFYAGFLFLTVILLMEQMQSPFAFVGLHYTPTPYWRMRLLTPESSHTALMLEIFFALSLYYKFVVHKSKSQTLLLLLCLLLHIVLSGSKTLLVAFLLILFLCNIQNLKKIKSKKGIFLLCLSGLIITLFCLYVLPNLKQQFIQDLEEYTSTVTRFYSIYCGFYLGCIYPVGTGFGAYLYLFPETMKSSVGMINKLGMDLNLNEIMSYANSKTDVAVTAKSFLGQSSMYWGIVGTIYFMRKYWKLCSDALRISKFPYGDVLKILSGILMVEMLFSSDFEFCVMAFLVVLIYIKKNVRYVHG